MLQSPPILAAITTPILAAIVDRVAIMDPRNFAMQYAIVGIAL